MLSMWYAKKTVLMMMNFEAGIVLAWLIFPCRFFFFSYFRESFEQCRSQRLSSLQRKGGK